MDENRFSAKVIPEKKYYKDFGCIHMKKSKNSLLFLILTIISFSADMVLTYCQGFGTISSMLTFTYLMFFYWLFYGDFIGGVAYRNIHKKQQGLPQTYYFGETNFSIYTELENSAVNYQALGDVYENGRIFALYNTKNTAFIIPKSSFVEGTPIQFRSFIGEKIGKEVKRVRTYDRTALRIVIAVLAFVFMFGAMFFADWLHDKTYEQPQTFSKGDYSVTLTREFEEDTFDDLYLGVFRDDVGILVYRYTEEELAAVVGESDSTLGYMQNLAEYFQLDRSDACWGSGGMACLEYTSEVDGDTWYYYDVLQMKGDILWLTEFFGPEEQADAYAEDFAAWAKTINIK